MTRRQVWQYRCDHCGKRNLSAANISKHEKHCTKNPDRVCRMCAASGGEQLSLAELAACVDISLPDEGYKQLCVAAGYCPACILATLQMCGAYRPGYTLMNGTMYAVMGLPTSPFDWKRACKSWWDDFNTVRCEENGYY